MIRQSIREIRNGNGKFYDDGSHLNCYALIYFQYIYIYIGTGEIYITRVTRKSFLYLGKNLSERTQTRNIY